MKKIKAKNTKQQKTPMDKRTKILLSAIAGVALLAVVILVLVESKGYITVRNESAIKLEYVEAYFVDMEGPISDVMQFENHEKGDSSRLNLEKIDMAGREANLEVRFKFEGHDELFVDAGYFNEEFGGKISVSFSDIEDGKVLLKVKAKAGILPSPYIQCNEEHVVNLLEEYVEE